MIRHSLGNRKNWEQTAVIQEGRTVTYQALFGKARVIAGLLPGGRQEAIAVFLPNGADYLAAFYGIIMSGKTVFPLNVRLTVHEVTPLLAQARVRAVVTARAYAPLFEEARQTIPVEILYAEELPETLPETECCDVSWVQADENEPMLLLATSGTTGSAKIVQLSEKNVESSSLAYISKMDYDKYPEGVIHYTLGTPFFSIYGILVLTVCIMKSFPIVVLPDGFTLEAFYQAVQAHRITHYEGGVLVGQWMEQMAGRDHPYDVSSLKYLGLAGSKISGTTLWNLIDRYPGVEFWPGYGMTETGPLIAKPDKRVDPAKLDAVGTKIDCVTLLLDVEGTLTDAPHTPGEVVVKGPNVMLGYYENEEETNKVLRDGFLYTGDIGYLDEDGYLYLCGRKKNVIITRGFNVYAEEVEESILRSGLAKDCLVYGESEPLAGEIVCADVVPMEAHITAEAIRAYCREHLALYKQPEKIRLKEALKKTATGKTERT